MKICIDDEINNYDKVNVCCNAFNKYMKCMKEIEIPIPSSVLKNISSTVDVSTIQNEKGNDGVEKKQKADIETIQRITKTNKSKRKRDETAQNEEYAKKYRGRKGPKKWFSWKK